MANHDYIFRYTASTDGSFAVKPNSANGPTSPASTIPYSGVGARAVSINTPFVLVGKGVAEYGQIVQNNIIYLAENFCNTTRPIPPMKGMIWYKSADYIDVNNPTDPITAGVYVWNGLYWNTLLVNGQLDSNLNLNGKRIVNVGAAVDPTDALNVASANAKYLQLSGGTISGNLTVGTVSLTNVPSAAADAVPKAYVDTAVSSMGSVSAAAIAAVGDEIDAINLQLPSFYETTGGAITGNVSIAGDLSLPGSASLTLASGAGIVDIGGRVVQNIALPVLAHDATNKTYVDDAITFAVANISIQPGTGGDGVVSNGTLDDAGVLTLTRTEGLPPVVISGEFATKVHTHIASGVAYDLASSQTGSVLSVVNNSINNTGLAIAALDGLMCVATSNPSRKIIHQTVLDNTTFVLGDQYTFDVWSDRLMVFVDGVKKYADTWSESNVVFQNAGIHTLVGIPAATYPQIITIDGAPHTINIAINATTTYQDMYQAIAAAIVAGTVPVACVHEQSYDSIKLSFISLTAGSGHTVSLSTAVGQLFASIPAASTPNVEVGFTLAYAEVGIPGDESNTIEFHVAPDVGAVMEIILNGAGIS